MNADLIVLLFLPFSSIHCLVAQNLDGLCMRALPKIAKHQSEMFSTYDGCALPLSPLPMFS